VRRLVTLHLLTEVSRLISDALTQKEKKREEKRGARGRDVDEGRVAAVLA